MQYFQALLRNHNKNALLWTQFCFILFLKCPFLSYVQVTNTKEMFSTKIPSPPPNKGHSRCMTFSNISQYYTLYSWLNTYF